EVAHRLGIVLGKLDGVAAAERIFRSLAEAQPENGHWHGHLGACAREAGRPIDAEACYRRALRLEPDYQPHHTGLANALGEQGRTEEALAQHRRAGELEPGRADGDLALGIELLLASRVEAQA